MQLFYQQQVQGTHARFTVAGLYRSYCQQFFARGKEHAYTVHICIVHPVALVAMVINAFAQPIPPQHFLHQLLFAEVLRLKIHALGIMRISKGR